MSDSLPICPTCQKPIEPGQPATDCGQRHWACIRPPDPVEPDRDEAPPIGI